MLFWSPRSLNALSQKERGRKYALAMERLLASENSRDLDRGMTHFERAVGLAGGGVNVTVDNRHQTAILNRADWPRSFEEVMDRVRAKLVAEQREQAFIAAPGDVSLTARVRSE